MFELNIFFYLVKFIFIFGFLEFRLFIILIYYFVIKYLVFSIYFEVSEFERGIFFFLFFLRRRWRGKIRV